MLPKFLLADNTDHPDTAYVVHTEYPRFIINLQSDEVELLEDVDDEDEDALNEEMSQLLEAAVDFYERELDRYEDEEE